MVAVVLLGLTVLAVLVAGWKSGPVAPASAPTAGEPVDHVVEACPQVSSRTRVVTGAAPVSGLGGGGEVRYGAPADLASAKGTRLRRGRLEEVDVRGRDDTVAVVADGAIAAGLFTFRVDSDGSALATGECASPLARWWFTGAGATLDHASELVLANVDTGPAVMDVRVLAPEGEADPTPRTRGLIVQPGETVRLPLVDVVPQQDDLAVGVTTSRGRVVAAVRDRFSATLGGPGGEDWMAGQDAPSRRVRLAGLPKNADSRSLVVANPSALEALVELRVSGETGSFAPLDAAQIRVPPGSVTTTDLTSVIGREPTAVTLRSTVPVTASLRSTSGGDSSYATPVDPLTGPAAAPVVEGATATVLLTAGSEPASAALTAYSASGEEVDAAKLDIDPGATVSWRVGRRAAYVLATPRKGQVSGAVSFTGPGVSQVPLRTLPVEVRRPEVVPSLR